MAVPSTKLIPANAADSTKPHHAPAIGSVHANRSSPVVLRSLSNKLRVVSDEITDDDGDYDDDSDKSYNGGWNPRRDILSSDEQKTHDSEYEDSDDVFGKSPKHDAEKIQGKNKPVWRSMSKYAKAHGMDLRKQVEENSTQKNEDSVNNRVEIEEMRKILEERKASSDDDEYHMPTESDRDTSPERNWQKRDVFSSGKAQNHAFDTLNFHEIKDMLNKSPSKVLEWLGGDGSKTSDRKISVSQQRIRSLLHALNETARLQAGIRDSLANIQNEWVSAERLREAEIRCNVAEDQIKKYEQLLNSVNDRNEEDRLHTVFSRTKTIERHFAHMKKFAEDRQQDLRKHYVLGATDRNGVRALYSLRSRGVSSERAKQDMVEHENHKKRLLEVQSMYNDLLSFLKFEHSKRLEIESKNKQISMQIKRQADALKRTEKVIKHTVLTGSESPSGSSLRSLPSSRWMSLEMGSLYPLMDKKSTDVQMQHIYDHGLQKTWSRNASIADDNVLQCQQNSHKFRDTHSPKFAPSMPSWQNVDTSAYPYLNLVKHHAHSDHIVSASEDSSSTQFTQNTSNMILNDTREFEELEQALLQEGKARGFADVDLYSEKKTTGKNQEMSCEYKLVHLNFSKPHDVTNSHGNALESSAQSSIYSNEETMRDSKFIIRAFSTEDHNNHDSNVSTKNHNLRYEGNKDNKQWHLYGHDGSSIRRETDNERLEHNNSKQEPSYSEDTKGSGILSEMRNRPKRILSLPVGNLLHAARKKGIERLQRSVKSMPEKATAFLHSKFTAMTEEVSHNDHQLISGGDECVIPAAAAKADNTLSSPASVQNRNLQRKIQQNGRRLFVQILIFSMFLMWCAFAIFHWHMSAPPT